MRSVLVTGATGRVGRIVVDELLRAGAHVRALTRQPDRADLPRGAEVIAGDLTVPSSLDAAVEGIDAVLLVWTVPVTSAAAVLARLSASGSGKRRRIVYLSAPFRTPHPFFQQPNPLRELHAELERLLAETNANVAVIRPGMFASNAVHWWAPQLRQGNVVRWPFAAAETAAVDERDVAAAAARLLLDSEITVVDAVLTGPASLSQAEQVHAIGMAIGRPLQFRELSPVEFRRETAGVWPPAAVEMLLSAWQATLGHRALVTSAVEEITHSPARTFDQWAADHAAAFHKEPRE